MPENKLIVYVDGSKDGTVEWLAKKDIGFIYGKWKGLGTATNAMVRQADSEFLCMVGDDTVFSPNWDKNFLFWAREDKIICPVLIEPPGMIRGRRTLGTAETAFGSEPKEFNEEAFVEYVKRISKHELVPSRWGAYFLTRELFYKIGEFDERFNPWGLFETDFFMRLMTKCPEVKVRQALDVIVYHFVSGSNIFSEWETLGPILDEKFKEKWGMSTGKASQKIDKWVGFRQEEKIDKDV